MKARELSTRIGALLRELRKDRGLSQRAAADGAGAPQPKLSLLEQGRLDFSALTLVARLSELLGVPVVEVLDAALGERATQVRPRFDRPWLVSGSRFLELLSARGTASELAPSAPAWHALGVDAPLARWVTALARSRAFGVVHGAHAGGWILPFAPALVRQVCDEFVASDAARALETGFSGRIVEELQRFPVAYELATSPAEALAVVDRLAAEYPLPELEYLRGVLLHQLGEAPLRVKGCVQRALDALEAAPLDDLRADLVAAGLLEYLEVAAEAAERGDRTAPHAEQRVDHAIRLLGLAGFAQGRVHLEVRRAIARHEKLRDAPASERTARDGVWEVEWRNVAMELARARAEYHTLGLAMGGTYVDDWLARHHELHGDWPRALALVEGAIDSYRRLGQRRWECSAQARAAYYREASALEGLGVRNDAAVTSRRLAGPAGERAVALLEATRAALACLLEEPGVTPYERPLLAVHLALASGRLAAWRASRHEPAEPVAELERGYREWKRAALADRDDDVDASAAAHREAVRAFRALEAAYPRLAARPGARAGRDRRSGAARR